MYKIIYRKSVIKALAKMSAKVALEFSHAFDALAMNNLAGLDVKKLEGREGYRLRIGGYRAIFRRLDDVLVIEVIDVGSRGDIYK